MSCEAAYPVKPLTGLRTPTATALRVTARPLRNGSSMGTKGGGETTDEEVAMEVEERMAAVEATVAKLQAMVERLAEEPEEETDG